ncbi:MAG: c-type cytochrome domain-containing protein [Planctomycetota bacterium]
MRPSLTLLAALSAGCLLALPLNAAEIVDYTRDVLPILEAHCVACHTADDAEGGLVMESHAALMRGGDSGVAVTAGVADSSRMLLMASGAMEPVMPPDGDGPSEAELAILAEWIRQGARGPEGDAPIRRDLRTPTIQPNPEISLPITSVASTSDGRLTAIGRFGSIEIRLRDGSPLTVIRQPPGMPTLGKINSLEFTRDGSRLLVASGLTGASGRAAVYDSMTGDLLLEMLGHSDTIYCATYSPDQSLIATAGYDRDVLLWDADRGEVLRTLQGHNGAIFDLAFSPDGQVLVSASADETAKVWSVASGKRLDTLSQPEGEVFCVDVTPDGHFVVAGSADNRIRVWQLRSKQSPQINPIVATRFVDETPVTRAAVSPDGKSLVVASEAGNIKVLRTDDWSVAAVLEAAEDTVSDLVTTDRSALVSLMNGRLETRSLPHLKAQANAVSSVRRPVHLDLGPLASLDEIELRQVNPNLAVLAIPRGATVRGSIAAPSESDRYSWHAKQGEVWAIDADAIKSSRLDPLIRVLDANGQPVLRVRLQATRDTYFTFRGKNSTQVNDFRLFAWQEMNLNDYLYAAGEVTRLWMHPRGPDSGFDVYPGEGNRRTYFGTTHASHALGEPAYIVRPLLDGESPADNGLPTFDVFYENDDDPVRLVGKNSRLVFTAPETGTYTIEIADARGEGAGNSLQQSEPNLNQYGYELRLRAARPSFNAKVNPISKPIPKGTGREFKVTVDRLDEFDGPVTFELVGLPDGLRSNTPLVVEPGQRFAIGTIWADPNTDAWQGEVEPHVTASATILGRHVERSVGSVGKLKLADPPKVVPSLHPKQGDVAIGEGWTLIIKRGETVTARVRLARDNFDKEVSFGKEKSGRNASHGVIVDNIGLNGLIVLKNSDERVFFVTASPTTSLGERSFFLTANVDGGLTTQPITVKVVP